MVNKMLKKSFSRDLLKGAILLGFGFAVASFAFSVGFIVNYITPFSFNLDETYIAYPDMCAGASSSILEYRRIVQPDTGWKATFTDELYVLKGRDWVETRIGREVTTVMQTGDGGYFEISWNKPIPVGIYSVSRRVEINPYFGVYKTKVEPLGEYVFKVSECHR